MQKGPLGAPRPLGGGPLVETDTTYLYRGGDVESINEQILDEGIVPGGEANILEATPTVPQISLSGGAKYDDIQWEGGVPNLPRDFRTVGVAGGVTHHLPSTRRFRGSLGLVAVLDSSKTPFERVSYEYDWMSKHPGALTQVLTRINGELHIPDLGLWATINRQPRATGGYDYILEHWKPENLPATDPSSRFADEHEWVAFEAPADISRGLEGVVSLTTERTLAVRARSVFDSVTDLEGGQEIEQMVYDHIKEQLEPLSLPFYMLVFRGDKIPEKPFYDGSSIVRAYSKAGQVGVSDVPNKYRGNS